MGLKLETNEQPGTTQIVIENMELLLPNEASALKVNSARANKELEELGLFSGVNYQPRAKIVDIATWGKSTRLSDQWIDDNPTKALMCCRADNEGFYVMVAMKDEGRLNPAELTDDDLREWGHEWIHPWQNTQMIQRSGKDLFDLNRGFLAEALCELIQRDLVGHGLPVELDNGLISISEIREKGFFAIDQNSIGQNTAYYSAYLWLRKLITGNVDRPASFRQVKQFLELIKQFDSTLNLDSGIESQYPEYIGSIN